MDLINPSSKNRMNCKTVTWLKDSHKLFDYQFVKKNSVTEDFKMSLQPCFIFFYRNNAGDICHNSESQIIFTKNDKMVPQKIEGAQVLGCVRVILTKDKKYKLEFHNASQFVPNNKKMQAIGTEALNNEADARNEGIFFVVRTLKDNQHEPKGYQLRTGQKLKFGRVQFNVTVVNDANAEQQHPNFFDYEQTLVIEENKIYDEEDACRICLSNQQSGEYNFFTKPCNCFGSCSLVHFECLFTWCKTKVKKSRQGSISHYNFDKFQCEICKKYFPRFIVRGKYKYDLLPIQKPQKPYMVLSSNGNEQVDKNIIIIHYSKQSILKVGRNQTCDIRIVDISVSRQHATIQMRDGQFYLYDNKSKFGTIISEQNFVLEVEKAKRGVQVGRTVITFQLADKDEQITLG